MKFQMNITKYLLISEHIISTSMNFSHIQDASLPQSPSSSSSILSAFESSFESFLNHKYDESETVPGHSKAINKLETSSANIQMKKNMDYMSVNQSSNMKLNWRKREEKRLLDEESETSLAVSSIIGSEGELFSDQNLYWKTQSSEAHHNVADLQHAGYETVETLPPKAAKTSIDNGERRYHCPSCPKTFKSNGHLKEHEMTHTGNFPFNCENCLKGFRRENQLQSHKCALNATSNTSVNSKESTKPNKVFKCEFCPKVYATKQGLQLHKDKCPGNGDTSSFSKDKIQPIYNSRVVTPRQPRRLEKESEIFIENVSIEVPVSVVSSEIIFDDNDGYAIIMGDVMHMDTEDITVDDAYLQGWQVDTVCETLVEIEGPMASPKLEDALPCAFEVMSMSSGLMINEVKELFEYYAKDEEEKNAPRFPWQNTAGSDLSEGKEVLPDEVKSHEAQKYPISTLDELTSSITKSKSLPKTDRRVSLNNFTYFNDKAASVWDNSGDDDTGDEDWSLSSKKKKQLKKPSKNSSVLSEKVTPLRTSKKTALSNSLLLQENDSDEEFQSSKR